MVTLSSVQPFNPNKFLFYGKRVGGFKRGYIIHRHTTFYDAKD